MSSSRALLTTNMVGGLGNQLFLIANLLATSRRNRIPVLLHRASWSSSHDAPRPTYWTSMFEHLDRFVLCPEREMADPIKVQTPPSSSRGTSASASQDMSTRSCAAASNVPTGARNSVPSKLKRESCDGRSAGAANDFVFTDAPLLACSQKVMSRTFVTVPETRPVCPILLSNTQNCVYSMTGFFQCARYFDDYPVIRDIIPARLRALSESHLRANYAAAEVHCIGVHIRRGDYVALSHIFEELSWEYYDAALEQLLGRVLLRNAKATGQDEAAARKPVVLLFCEDAVYAQCTADYWAGKYPGVRVTPVHTAHEAHALEVHAHQPREVVELLMLSLCDDIVMANSTFSWWAAYLNTKPMHRVVAPVRWFVQDPYPRSNHLYCDKWLLV